MLPSDASSASVLDDEQHLAGYDPSKIVYDRSGTSSASDAGPNSFLMISLLQLLLLPMHLLLPICARAKPLNHFAGVEQLIV